MELSPVVAGHDGSGGCGSGGRESRGSGSESNGGDNDSVVTEGPPHANRFTYYRSKSHTAEDAKSDVMEAGDTPYQVGMKDIAKTFTEDDWRYPKNNTLIQGEWNTEIPGMERKAFAIEN